MNCIILAGGTPAEDDRLYAYTQTQPKALLKVGQQTMLQHVIAAVQPIAQALLIVGIEAKHLPALESNTIILPDYGSMVCNIEQGLMRQLIDFGRNHILIVTADVPLLTTEAIIHFLALCQPLDHLGYYPLITKAAIEARYPQAQRTYGKLRDHTVTGGNIALLHTDLLTANLAICEQLVNARKSGWRLARQVGVGTLFKLLTRQITVAGTSQIASKLFGAPLKAILTPYAELAMDVDKPEHLDGLRPQISRLATV